MSTDQLFQAQNQSTVQTPPAQQTVVTEEGEKKYFDQLVGEDKKFKDQEALAKGKAESDAFIEQLQKENEGLRGELNNRLAVENFVDQLKQAEPVTPTSTNVEQTETQQSAEGQGGEIATEDLNKLVEDAITVRMGETQKQVNVDAAMRAAINKYGDNYKSELSSKAKELGLGIDFLTGVAEQNPETFINIMGLKEETQVQQQQQQSNQSNFTPGSDRITPDTGSQGRKKFSDFEQLRINDPATYWSPKVQNELMELTASEGEKFFQN